MIVITVHIKKCYKNLEFNGVWKHGCNYCVYINKCNENTMVEFPFEFDLLKHYGNSSLCIK